MIPGLSWVTGTLRAELTSSILKSCAPATDNDPIKPASTIARRIHIPVSLGRSFN